VISLVRQVALSLCAALTIAACSRAPAPAAAPPKAGAAPELGVVHALPLPVAADGGEPRLSLDARGQPLLSWLEPAEQDGELALKYARLAGEQWAPASVAAHGSDWVVSAADLPSVQALSERLLVADWRVPSPVSPAAYDILVAVSADGGATWSDPLLLNDDATASEHGFVSWFRAAEQAGVVWLDGRDEADEAAAPSGDEPLGTSLRYALLDERGQRLEQGVVDRLTCDCCRTAVAATAAGTAVIYRDRSATEIRDISVKLRSPDGWSEPVRLGPDGWQIAGCPINGPALDAAGNDVAAAWFTAAEGRGRVRFARSSDGGRSFGAPVEVDDDGAIGQVGVALAEHGTAFVSWWRRGAAGGAELAVRAVTSHGELGEPKVVGSTHASRPDTVPQLVRAGDRLVLVWTEDGDEGQVVKAAYAELPAGA
jgi:hypothetical protein